MQQLTPSMEVEKSWVVLCRRPLDGFLAGRLCDRQKNLLVCPDQPPAFADWYHGSSNQTDQLNLEPQPFKAWNIVRMQTCSTKKVRRRFEYGGGRVPGTTKTITTYGL